MKSGFVSIIGKPNVGKSTFLNQIMHKKIAIVSNRPQTTRNQIRGIVNEDGLQIVFIDTPGIHKNKNLLDKYMNKQALKSTKGVDVILLLFSVLDDFDDDAKYIIKNVVEKKVPIIVLITKVDIDKKTKRNMIRSEIEKIIDPELLLGIYDHNNLNFEDVAKVREKIASVLPEGPMYYDLETTSDVDEIFFVKEIIREKCLVLLDDEVPHHIGVYINDFSEEKNKDGKDLVKIDADIIVERQTHKQIVIGKGGEMIKKIGQFARQDLEEIFGVKVFLKTFVKVKEKWFDNENNLNNLGYKDS